MVINTILLIKKLCVCDKYFMQPKDLITYKSLVKNSTHEYHIISNSKWWDPAESKDGYKYHPSLPNAYTV